MAQREDEHWSLDEGLDPEGPSAEDLERFGDEMRRCPSCGEDVYDQAELCTNCGHAFEDDPRGSAGKLWVIVAGVIALVAFTILALGGRPIF